MRGSKMRNARFGRIAAAVSGLVAAGAIGIVSATYANEVGDAKARVASGSTLAQTRCGPIEYAEAGSGSPVLVVHGAGGGYDQGMDFGRPLAKAGFRVVAMSRFGYLRTPLPADASAAAQADAHACLLDALKIKTAAIIGASAGAPSSMQFALRYPDRTNALVLLVPAAYVPRPGNAAPTKTPAWTEFLFGTALRFDFLFWGGTKVAKPTLTRALLATPMEDLEKASPAERARADTILSNILPVSPRRLGMLNDAAVVSSLPRYELEKISVPTLTISAANDLFGTFEIARYTAANVPGARFVGYETGGHITVGHSDEIINEIATFLK
jgi:pimeloyl-ACP methyl ester carboxylesterase